MPAGGRLLVTKTSVYATSRSGGVGEGGCHHAGCGGGGGVTMRLLGVENVDKKQPKKTLQERIQ